MSAEHQVRRLENAISTFAVSNHNLNRIHARLGNLNFQVEQARREVETEIGNSRTIMTIDADNTDNLLQALKQLSSKERALDKAEQALCQAERDYNDAQNEYNRAKASIIRSIDNNGIDSEPADTDSPAI